MSGSVCNAKHGVLVAHRLMGNCCIRKQYLEYPEETERQVAELRAGVTRASQETKAVDNPKSETELTFQAKTFPRVYRAVRHSSCGVENRSLTPTAPPAPRSLYPDLSRVRSVSPPPSPSVFCPPRSFNRANISGKKVRSHSLPATTERVDRQPSSGRVRPSEIIRAVPRPRARKTRRRKKAARRARNERAGNDIITIGRPTERRSAGCRKKKVKFNQRCN